MSLLDTLTREPLTVPFQVGLGRKVADAIDAPVLLLQVLIGFCFDFIPHNCPDRLHLINHGTCLCRGSNYPLKSQDAPMQNVGDLLCDLRG